MNVGRPDTAATADEEIDRTTRWLHLALALCGIVALISGQFAGDYRDAVHPGFAIHQWCGLVAALVVGLRFLRGLFGPLQHRFAAWVPLTRQRLAAVVQDISCLLRRQLPVRPMHEGLAGLVQVVGLTAFAWMAVSGSLMFVWLEPGARAVGGMRVIKQLHEGGQVVLWGYLALHVGAVVAHSLTGHPLWRRMFFPAVTRKMTP